MEVNGELFAKLGAKEVLNEKYHGMDATFTRNWMSHFGTMPNCCCWIWEQIDPTKTMPTKSHPRHLLWALFFLRTYPCSESVAVSGVGNGSTEKPNVKTYRKWIHEYVTAISYLESQVVSLACNLYSFFGEMFS